MPEVKVGNLDHSFEHVLKIAERGGFLKEGRFQMIGPLEWALRTALAHFISRVDTPVQLCLRKSLEAIGTDWKKHKSENPSATTSELFAHARCVRTLFLSETQNQLDALRATCHKAHQTALGILNKEFGLDEKTGAPKAEGILALSALYLYGQKDFKADLRVGYDILARHAAKGNDEAKVALALLHKEGKAGITQDVEYAKQLLQEAVANGHGQAQELLKQFKKPGEGLTTWLGKLFSKKQEKAPRPEGSNPAQTETQLALFHPKAKQESRLNQLLAQIFPPQPPPASLENRELRVQAENGEAEASLELALRYQKGTHGLTSDEVEAKRYLNQALAQGSDIALEVVCMNLQIKGSPPDGEEDDQASLRSAYNKEIAHSDEMKATAFVVTGHFFLDEATDAFNPLLAKQCFERAVKLGSMQGMHSMGLYHQRITGKESKAQRYFEKAAQKGTPESLFEIGFCCTLAIHKKRPDYARARECFELAAKENYPPAMHMLSHLLKEGLGGPPDPIRAEELLLTLEKDYFDLAPPDAFAELGDLYRKGEGSARRNLPRAMDLYDVGMKQGSVRSYIGASAMYQTRATQSRSKADKEKAFGLLKEAGQLEQIKKIKTHGALTFGEGACALAKAFEEGVVCKRDEELALAYYCQAAQEGCKKAWEKLRCVYRDAALGTRFLLTQAERDAKAQEIAAFIKKFEEDQLFNPKTLPTLFAPPRKST